MSSRAFWIGAAIVVLAAAAFGFRAGRQPTGEAAHPLVARAQADLPATAAKATTKTPPSFALPANLDDLDGTEFVDALPELERRARAGDEKSTQLLIDRLNGCANFAPQDDDAIRQSVEEDYQRQLDIQQRFPSSDKRFVIDEKWRDDELKRELDANARCRALTREQIGRRFDWALLGLSRHDRNVIVGPLSRGALNPDAIERVRYADTLVDLVAQETAELNRLVDAGDVEAMRHAAQSFASPDMTMFEKADFARAYAIAYALSLGGDPNRWSDWFLQNTAKRLSPDQIESARREGEALYQRCCAAGQAVGSH